MDDPGIAAVAGLLGEWRAARHAFAEMERAEHPDIIDQHGRVWTWRGGDLYAHDDTLAFPKALIDGGLGLPSAALADNPNYSRLCAICRSAWPVAGG
jgi:hypothetical protein